MILSASRRTDIPAYYSKWFLNRLKAGYALVRSPYRPSRLWRVDLSPDVVDAIVFWTKDPAPMLDKLSEIGRMGYPFYFQYTLTPYGPEIEPGSPPAAEAVETFRRLAERIGPERMVWRYDPVILTGRMTPEWHFAKFEALCRALRGSTEECVFSFLDEYAKTRRSAALADRLEITPAAMRRIAAGFSQIAAGYGLTLRTCCEEIDLSACCIAHGACIDRQKIEKLAGCRLRVGKDRNQRPACGCAESVDIGAYNTCPRGCVYCYAVSSAAAARRNAAAHDPESPLLSGRPPPEETVVRRKCVSLKDPQLKFFE